MFEQSILLPDSPAKRARALTASLAIQAVALGGLLLLPPLYMDQLPFTTPSIPLFVPRLTTWKPVLKPMPETPAPTERRAVLPIPFRMPEADLRAGNRPSVVPLIDAPSSLGEPGLGESGLMLASGLGAEIPIYRGALLANPPAAPNTTIAPIAPAVPAAPISVPSDVQAAKLIRKVIPVYPQMARVTRTQGTVRITGTIGKDGAIARLQLVSGHPLLVQAALEAVKQWTYQPTLLNGQPVEVITTIDVMFRLN